MRLGYVALILAVASTADAQPGAEPEEPPPPVVEEPPPPPPPPPPVAVVVAPPPAVAATSTVDPGVIEDANSGRSWLSPTALTPPAGTWSFSDFELLLVSGGYAITDQFSISATTLLPIVDEMPFFGILSAKLQVINSGRLRGAAQLAIMHLRDNSDFDSDASLTVANLGGALTLCLDDGCHSHVTGYLGAGFADQDQQAVPFVASAALTLRLKKHIKLVLEADTAFIAGDINETAEGLLAWYGVRFTSKMIGVDLGFAKPICDGCDDGIAMGIPFVSFTYRDFKE